MTNDAYICLRLATDDPRGASSAVGGTVARGRRKRTLSPQLFALLLSVGASLSANSAQGALYSASVGGFIESTTGGGPPDFGPFSLGTGGLTPHFQAESRSGVNWSVAAKADATHGGTVEANAHLVVFRPGVESYATTLTAESSLQYSFTIAGTNLDPLIPVILMGSGGVDVSSGGGAGQAGLVLTHDGYGDLVNKYVSLNYGATRSEGFAVNQLVYVQPGDNYSLGTFANAQTKASYIASDDGVGSASASVDPTLTIQGEFASRYHFVGLPDSAIGGAPSSPVPEPASWGLVIAGSFAIGSSMRRRKGAVRLG